MTCQELLARHSEYVDGELDPRETAQVDAHLAACASCSRYDRVVRSGLRLLRKLPEVEPSSDFFPRLQHRIYNMEEELRAAPRSSGIGAVLSLAVAGTIAVLAWSPLLWLGRETIGVDADARRAAVEAPSPERGREDRRDDAGPRPDQRNGGTVQLAAEAKDLPHIAPVPGAWGGLPPAGSPLVDPETWWWTVDTGPAAVLRSVRTTVDFRTPGPYSPLIVEAPSFRRAARIQRTERGRIGRD